MYVTERATPARRKITHNIKQKEGSALVLPNAVEKDGRWQTDRLGRRAVKRFIDGLYHKLKNQSRITTVR